MGVSKGLKEAAEALRGGDKLYALMSDSTRLPFVECDEETCDDTVLLFEREEDALAAAKRLEEDGYPARCMELPAKQRLSFFSSLFSMGVNALKLNKGTREAGIFALEQLVVRPQFPRYNAEIGRQLKQGKDIRFLVENPEFHLTAIYYIQKVRNRQAQRWKKEAEQLHEEMLAHYREGHYLAPRLEDGGMPLLKKKEGPSLHPLFTDQQEFAKFARANAGMEFQNLIVSERDFLKVLTKDASGIIINPFGISLVLQVSWNR